LDAVTEQSIFGDRRRQVGQRHGGTGSDRGDHVSDHHLVLDDLWHLGVLRPGEALASPWNTGISTPVVSANPLWGVSESSPTVVVSADAAAALVNAAVRTTTPINHVLRLTVPLRPMIPSVPVSRKRAEYSPAPVSFLTGSDV